MNYIQVSCEKSLIEEALSIWDSARCTGSTAELRKALPLNLMDAGPPALNRNKSASLPRQLCSSSGGFTLKDISDDEDDDPDGHRQDKADFCNSALQNARYACKKKNIVCSSSSISSYEFFFNIFFLLQINTDATKSYADPRSMRRIRTTRHYFTEHSSVDNVHDHESLQSEPARRVLG